MSACRAEVMGSIPLSHILNFFNKKYFITFYKNKMILTEYLIILICLIFGLILSLLLFFGSYFLVLRNYDVEKTSAYECGFDPFGEVRLKFDVRFYLVAILFIIFDLEVMFLFPWVVSLAFLNTFGYWIMFLFLVVLTVGFFYEWSVGALDWE